MATVTFTGSNESGYVEYWGYHFPCGEAVEVDSAEAIEGAERHPEFEVAADRPAKAENPPAESEKPAAAPKTAPKARKPRKARK